LKLGNENSEVVIELPEEINLDTSFENKIGGIETLNVSQKIDLTTITILHA